MFTGIVEECGTVAALVPGQDSARLTIRGQIITTDTKLGDSICCQGVCLTVTDLETDCFSVDVMAETLRCSSLGSLSVNDPINLERAMPATGRFGGHLLQGHVDATAVLLARFPGDAWEILRFSLPKELSRYVVGKGSIGINGVSLTVSSIDSEWFEVSLIPTTMAVTTLGKMKVGEQVNIEVDVIAKYVEKMMGLER